MVISVSDLHNTNGNKGFIIPGKAAGDRLGSEVYSAGDFNGDGIDDLVVTATDAGIPLTDAYSYYDSDRRGKAYIVFGQKNSKQTTFDLDNLNGNNGFSVSGLDAEHNLGNAVSAGDLNGDGIDDLVLGAANAGLNVTSYGYSYSENNGEAYVIFGQRNGFDSDFDLNSLNGNNGFILKGIDPSDLLGTAVASAGDLNGDGIDDLAVSAIGAGQAVTNDSGFTYSDSRGEVYVVFGKNNGFVSRLNLFNLNGSDGFVLKGKDANDSLGGSLSNGGDINGDGIDDLIIGASNAGNVLNSPFANGHSDKRGEVYVLFGSRNGFQSNFNVADRLNGNQGFMLSGIGTEDNLGSDVSNIGDLNGDGIDELIVSAAKASVAGEYSQEGQAYVVFGRQGGFNAQFDLNSLDGNNGFSLAGIDPADGFGNAVSAGDFNGDGIDDLLVGASNGGENLSAYGYDYSDRRGEAYVIFGRQNGFTSQVNLANLNSNLGAKIAGIRPEDMLGNAVSSGGDINGDGADDLVVSAVGVDRGQYTREGSTYVIFGTPANPNPKPKPNPKPNLNLNSNPNREATPFNDKIVGSNQNDRISGQSGDDTISGGDGNDLLNGEDGRDSLFGDRGNDTVNGGNNNDTLFGAGGDDILNGDNDRDKLVGDAGNDLLLGGTENDLLKGGGGNDTLIGTNYGNLEVQLGEQDTLIGGSGRDLLILGDSDRNFYNDRNPQTEGSTDYALIRGFDESQDNIQLQGDRSLYRLSFSTYGGTTFANLFYQQPGEVAERIAIIENPTQNLTTDDAAFIYKSASAPKPAPPQLIVIDEATPYNDNLKGSSGNDQISGQSGDDTLSGGDGNDSLFGDGGKDSLFGDGGNDSISGGNNGDTLFGAAGDDILNGDKNQDRLVGDEGNDLLLGGDDNDFLEGGTGDDTLIGANFDNAQAQLSEQDTLIGGAGRDLFFLGNKDRIYYDDRNSGTSGSTDYALIKDFDPAQDQILLKGDSSLYELSLYPDGSGSNLANLLYLEPGGIPERVGIIENISNDLTINNRAFSFI